MFTKHTFIKKTRVGNFLKNVREHYIRDDIYCGVPTCRTCPETASNLSDSFDCRSSLHPGTHYAILDTNVVLDQIDALEEPTLGNVVVPHTVLKEVRHRSLPVYKRLHALVENPSRHFYIFTDDHHRETYLERGERESPNDYNDRRIRATCSWYARHLPDEQIVFLTDDAENRRRALDEGIAAHSIEEYVSSLADNAVLLDKLSRREHRVDSNARDVFPPHLSNVQLLQGVREGRLLQGTFRASRDNFLEGTVNVESMTEPVIVQGMDGLNRSVDGDVVVVELLPEPEWVAPSEIVLEDEGTLDDVDEIERKLRRASGRRRDDIKPTGRVVGVVRRKWRQYCGVLQDGVEGLVQLFVPSDRSIPKIRIETRQAAFLRTQKLIVSIDSWPRYSRYPVGHFVRALGKIGDSETENEVVLLEHDVPHNQFSEEVLGCLPTMPWVITEEDLNARVDLRHIDVCSVDPPGCTDIDDALHCRRLDGDRFEVGVHIADVSHFIRPGTAIDAEAALRATTVYLVNKRIDMVPELLSSNLCSLRGGEERFAFSCVWTMNRDAEILDVRFHKSVIRSRRAMTYEEAQLTIDDPSRSDAIAVSLRDLNSLAKVMKRRRMENGALSLASPEVKVHVDSETMEPLDVEAKKMFETNSMVEEFMLQANMSVAERILREFPECALLRRHPRPPAANFEPLIKAGRHLGFEIVADSGKELAASLDAAEVEADPYLNTMLRILATRCMLQAVYFPSGMFRREEYFHYGLAVPLYTHFTSPIRRYADVIVHRLLAVCCRSDSTYPDLLDKDKTNSICQNLNYRNRMAQYAGRASVAFNTHLFFRGKLEEEQGYVLYVRKNALQILIPKFGLECTLYLSQRGKPSDYFTYDEEEQTQRAGDVVLRAFDPVTVRLSLDTRDVQHEKFALQLVRPYVEGFSVEPLHEEAVVEPLHEEVVVEPLHEEVVVEPKRRKRNRKGKGTGDDVMKDGDAR